MNQRILPTLLIIGLTIGALGLGHFARSSHGAPQPPPSPEAPSPSKAQTPTPRIDVVFVLDTTGSMSGLLEGAKDKIWSIANRIVSGDPQPDVRFGLVGYRDRGDAYVTQVTSLSRDLDAVHQELRGLRAQGGGDTPEDVNAALAAALHQQPWEEEQDVLRLVFLVGDAPPHEDYEGPKSWELAQTAKAKGIIINTVQCGRLHGTKGAWTKIAQFAGGAFDAISQDGGMKVASTPFDKDLAELNRDLADTVLAYGSARAKRSSRRKMAARGALRDELAASAAAYNAKANRMNDEDLLTQLDSGKVKLGKLKTKDLPEDMQKLDESARAAKVKKMRARRMSVKKKILALSAKREAYLKAEKKKGKNKSEFDDRLMKNLAKQAASIEVAY